jgi:hypothetical protein
MLGCGAVSYLNLTLTRRGAIVVFIASGPAVSGSFSPSLTVSIEGRSFGADREDFPRDRAGMQRGQRVDAPIESLVYPIRLSGWRIGLNRFAGVRGRSHRCTFGNLPGVIFPLIFPLTVFLTVVIASLNQFHSRRHLWESYVTEWSRR